DGNSTGRESRSLWGLWTISGAAGFSCIAVAVTADRHAWAAVCAARPAALARTLAHLIAAARRRGRITGHTRRTQGRAHGPAVRVCASLQEVAVRVLAVAALLQRR